jgi:hypothetical protein
VIPFVFVTRQSQRRSKAFRTTSAADYIYREGQEPESAGSDPRGRRGLVVAPGTQLLLCSNRLGRHSRTCTAGRRSVYSVCRPALGVLSGARSSTFSSSIGHFNAASTAFLEHHLKNTGQSQRTFRGNPCYSKHKICSR